MNTSLYTEFRNCADRGDRERAARLVRQFIDSFENETERRTWVREFLENGDYGHKIRHELYRDLIFPELCQGYRTNDPWSLYFLAHTVQNVYKVRELHERLDWKSDYTLLESCYRVAPDFRDVRAQLLDRVSRGLHFAIHEWPTGLLGEIEELESELSFAKTLDSENTYFGLFGNVEAVLKEAKARARAKASNPLSKPPP